ncbi:MAG: hypothetical protein E7320_03690 [Clostridiales bacterium]|nr:hypothetical protein [Clostridiales bacterium]
MRTLDELLTAAKEAKNGYSANVQRAEQERQLLQKALSAARTAQEAAAASGDRAAYDKAHSDEKYASARLAAIAQPKPFFTREENNAFAAEVRRAYVEAVKPHYKHLQELRHQWQAVLDQINEEAQKVRIIGNKMNAAHPQNRDYSIRYDKPYECLSPRLDTFKDGEAVHAIDTFLRIYDKE